MCVLSVHVVSWWATHTMLCDGENGLHRALVLGACTRASVAGAFSDHQTRGLTEVPACCFFTVSYRHRFMQLAHILWLHGFEACVTVSRVQMLQSSVLMVSRALRCTECRC